MMQTQECPHCKCLHRVAGLFMTGSAEGTSEPSWITCIACGERFVAKECENEELCTNTKYMETMIHGLFRQLDEIRNICYQELMFMPMADKDKVIGMLQDGVRNTDHYLGLIYRLAICGLGVVHEMRGKELLDENQASK